MRPKSESEYIYLSLLILFGFLTIIMCFNFNGIKWHFISHDLVQKTNRQKKIKLGSLHDFRRAYAWTSKKRIIYCSLCCMFFWSKACTLLDIQGLLGFIAEMLAILCGRIYVKQRYREIITKGPITILSSEKKKGYVFSAVFGNFRRWLHHILWIFSWLLILLVDAREEKGYIQRLRFSNVRPR